MRLALLWVCTAVAASFCTVPEVRAQAPATSEIKVGAKSNFRHRHSKLVLPPVLGGIARSRGVAIEPDELDLYFEHAAADLSEAYTVYVYRHVAGGLPVWFDRARAMIERRAALGTAEVQSAGAFIPPGRNEASGLLATYALTGRAYRSTGVALMPLGEWMVKLRASSKTLSPSELEARMKAALAELRWPSRMTAAPALVPVEPCTTPLALSGEAKPLSGEDAGAENLMGALLGQMADNLPDAKLPSADAETRWCRDATLVENAGVFRADGAADRYLIALGDAGRALNVGPSAGAGFLDEEDAGSETSFAVRLVLPARTMTSRVYDRLPPPAQAVAIWKEGRFASSHPTWGKNKGRMDISPDAMK
jgi:hypothetical protein